MSSESLADQKADSPAPGAVRRPGVYDKTGKPPCSPTKVRVNFTVDEELYHNFRQFCKHNGLKMSQVVEVL
ncbi:MAG TPA: hypothetical protein EYP46_00435 [Hadesarchaea archaeon]|nr:hypothetical protein [Hadesarchaea archaeon]